MGFWSSVGSALSSVVSAACSVVNSVASILGSIANRAITILEMGASLAIRVGEAIKAVGISLGIIMPNDDLQELGEKAMMSEKTPADFDSISAYIDHLRNDVTIDREKFSRLDEKELLARSAIGSAITLQGINEKLETVVCPQFMAMVATQNLTADEIVATIKTYKEKSLSTSDYSLYLKDELSIAQSREHSNALVEAYQQLEPELSIEQIEDKVMGLRA
ncbi:MULTISPECIES: hypothetical protein [Vibrio]|nr:MULTISPECIES: hypothetical protein [Vibrio]MCO7020819.1 hypothetical protein [Vibrio paracholerae]MCO7029871.1 hypothetical protein [Vibrio paracholerae]MCO7066708.1 hypothetical protein [Vibrio paracholerae]BCK04880.1 hypothetical protein VCSRO162_3070 [Vibrio cholerae]GHY23203.1 hypothetical protein VCSRO113_2126 [Vibrio cholerae]